MKRHSGLDREGDAEAETWGLVGGYRACDLRDRAICRVIGAIDATNMKQEKRHRIEVSRFGSAKGHDLDGGIVGVGVVYKVFRKAEQCSNAIRIAHVYDTSHRARLHVPEHLDRLGRCMPDDI